jgi:hypothetical protein
LNPHAAAPLDPDAPLLAERDKLAASLAAMRDKADRNARQSKPAMRVQVQIARRGAA